MLHIVYAHNNINIVNEPECLNNNYYYDDEFNTAYIIIYCTRYNIIRVSSMKKISLKKTAWAVRILYTTTAGFLHCLQRFLRPRKKKKNEKSSKYAIVHVLNKQRNTYNNIIYFRRVRGALLRTFFLLLIFYSSCFLRKYTHSQHARAHDRNDFVLCSRFNRTLLVVRGALIIYYWRFDEKKKNVSLIRL